jgi:hypothetical protein
LFLICWILFIAVFTGEALKIFLRGKLLNNFDENWCGIKFKMTTNQIFSIKLFLIENHFSKKLFNKKSKK